MYQMSCHKTYTDVHYIYLIEQHELIGTKCECGQVEIINSPKGKSIRKLYFSGAGDNPIMERWGNTVKVMYG